jgi:hypothetical protein
MMDTKTVLAFADMLGIDTLRLTEESILSHQEQVMSSMVRLGIMSHCSGPDSKLEAGALEGDVTNAVTRMSTAKLISFEKSLPRLLAALDEMTKVFESASDVARRMLEDHAGLPEDEEETD